VIKHLSKKFSLSLCLKAAVSVIKWRCEGRLFQASGQAKRKTHVPNFVLVRGLTQAAISVDQRPCHALDSVTVVTMSIRYCVMAQRSATLYIHNWGVVLADLLTWLCLHCHIWQMIRQLGQPPLRFSNWSLRLEERGWTLVSTVTYDNVWFG